MRFKADARELLPNTLCRQVVPPFEGVEKVTVWRLNSRKIYNFNMSRKKQSKTIVGDVEKDVLKFTSGADIATDIALAEVDCIGTAAHVGALSRLPSEFSVLSETERKNVIRELAGIISQGRKNKLKIRESDQDVHLMVERLLTSKLGNTGKKVHTGRSRNDQAAVDIRLLAKRDLPELMLDVSNLVRTMLSFARKNRMVPMMGRTHSQPAMLSSVGLWASCHAESMIDDLGLIRKALETSDKCPLGSAAGYGVPLPLDRKWTASALGFSAPNANVLYAGNSRGKYELVVLSALHQLMLSFSRLSEDLILFSMPEFGYFELPGGWCTGSSIMPQKKNPDVLELVRARTAVTAGCVQAVSGILTGLQSGYSRDLQETKKPFIDGLETVCGCAGILGGLMKEITINRERLCESVSCEVFATDKALELVGDGMPFRAAYKRVRENIADLAEIDPVAALKRREQMGWSGRIDFDALKTGLNEQKAFARRKSNEFKKMVTRLFGIEYPEGFDREA